MEIEAIQKLIATDEKVRQDIRNVYEERRQEKLAVEEEKKNLSDTAWAEVHETVEKTRAMLDAKIKKDDEQNQAYYAEASSHLQKQYDEKKAEWRKTLYLRVLYDKETDE